MTTLNEEDSARLLADLENGCSPEEAERRKEYAKRELAKMGLGPAAGPWIRVDSGERPEPEDGCAETSVEVLVCTVIGDCYSAWFSHRVHRWYRSGNGAELTITHWARIRPPEER